MSAQFSGQGEDSVSYVDGIWVAGVPRLRGSYAATLRHMDFLSRTNSIAYCWTTAQMQADAAMLPRLLPKFSRD